MDDKKIEDLFAELSKEYSEIAPETKDIFRTLIHSTLTYRDELKKQGDILKVEEVQAALDYFISFIKESQIPNDIPQRQLELLTRWVKAFNSPTVH
jgi:hypothetical protein